jgi:hypothetical protein
MRIDRQRRLNSDEIVKSRATSKSVWFQATAVSARHFAARDVRAAWSYSRNAGPTAATRGRR